MPLIALLACGQQTKQLAHENVRLIEDVDKAYVNAVLEQNWKALVEIFTDEVVYMPPNADAIVGRQTNLDRFQKREWNSVEYEHKILDINGSGIVGYVYGTYTFSIDLKNTGETFSGKGKYLSVLKKQEDGEWLIDKMIWNSSPLK